MTENHDIAVSDLLEPDFWRSFAPALSITDAPGGTPALARRPRRDASSRERLIAEGYGIVSDMGWSPPFEAMIDVMMRLRDMGLPPAFVGLYDAPWIMAAELRGLVDNLFDGPAQMVPDFWGWVVKPGEAGFDAHRDRPAGSIDREGRPMTLTVWVPLTKVPADNACMHVLPAGDDANYLKLGEDGAHVDLQSVRAVPGRPGDVLFWTGRAVHWGGKCSPFARGPRVSIAWEFQTAAVAPVEGAIVESYPALSFEQRISLLARQIGFYRNRQSNGTYWTRIMDAIDDRYPETAFRRVG